MYTPQEGVNSAHLDLSNNPWWLEGLPESTGTRGTPAPPTSPTAGTRCSQ